MTAKTYQFFPNPEVIEIKGEAPMLVETSKEVSNCRLKSSSKSRGYQPPSDIEYALPPHPAFVDIREYLEKNEIKGYGTGAIVARRFALNWRWKFVSQWGVILIANRHTSGSFPYAPYRVKWFDEQEPEEGAWAEDLIVIHPCVDESYLSDIVESQGIVIEDKR